MQIRHACAGTHRHTLRAKVVVLGNRAAIRHLVIVANVERRRGHATRGDGLLDARAVGVVNVLRRYGAADDLGQAILGVILERLTVAARHAKRAVGVIAVGLAANLGHGVAVRGDDNGRWIIRSIR